MPVMPSNAVPSSMVAYWAEVVQTQLASSGPTMKSSAQIEDNQSSIHQIQHATRILKTNHFCCNMVHHCCCRCCLRLGKRSVGCKDNGRQC